MKIPCTVCGKPVVTCQSRPRLRCSMECRTKDPNYTAKLAGPLKANWKGGRKRSSHGYILVLAKHHPRADRWGYVYEHIIAAENKIGRPLRNDESPHHLNRVKSDNRPENLQVMTRTEHKRLHWIEDNPRKRSVR